jgi:hypothetical protein
VYFPSTDLGGNLLIRASLFKNGLTFNTNFGPKAGNYIMGGETELLARLESSGHSALYLPQALVYHQIRNEQLNIRWLAGRAFREGRRQFHSLQIPKKNLWKLIAKQIFLILKNVCLLLKAIFSLNRKLSCIACMKIFHSAGQLNQALLELLREPLSLENGTL